MKIHVVGIGGIGLSALASILQRQGNMLSGSDRVSSFITEKLQLDGITVFTDGHHGGNVPAKTDRVIYSLAIPEDNPELVEARRRKIPTFTYPEAVGELTREFRTVSIAGTHGKSTVTAMVSKILIENNFDPSVIVGTVLNELDGRNFRLGASKLLVIESCEYKRAFLNYFPGVILLNTLDPDHLDYYKDFNDYISAFDDFALRLPRDGYFFANLDDENVHEVLKRLQQTKFPSYNTFTYSSKYPGSTFYLKENDIYHESKLVGKLDLKVPGFHNRMNALGAFALCAIFGVAPTAILKSLNAYAGAYRRFELKGHIGRTAVIDDYGHHPVEIKATLQAARERFGRGKICVVFQPHQYNRTKNLFNDFAMSFGEADTVIIPNIYEVRDTNKDRSSVTAQDLVSAIFKNHPHGKVLFGDGIEKTEEYLKKNHAQYAAILVMGAGDITDLANDLID